MPNRIEDLVNLPPSGGIRKAGQSSQSIDRTSQHLRITQNLARELESKLTVQLQQQKVKEDEYWLL